MTDENVTEPVIEKNADGSSATGDQSPEESQKGEKPLTFEQRFDAVLRHLRDKHGIHLPEHLAPKE